MSIGKKSLNIIYFIIMISTGCSNKDDKSGFAVSEYPCDVTKVDWSILANKRIFFGRQSVGKNIIDGIKDIQSQNNISALVFLETKDSSDFKNPVFAHSRIGNSLDPKSKIVDFVNIIRNELGNCVDIALMKIGFPDINKHTDIHELFEFYCNSIDSLKKEYPRLNIIHCTISLTTRPQGVKGLLKVILKMDSNVYRNNFNELMRNRYSQDEIFDIARIQATFTDGTSYIYRDNIPGMIPEYSSDGGHLNQFGKQVLACELLSKLTYACMEK